ncbi:MAG TPA: DUF962 domain-containing protein [Chloroflexia bacterium]|nr:DUF962 domain-containing protein [Chloroflexia bacterium]
MSNQKYETLAEFWPFYVREHQNPANRWMHFIGTSSLFVWLLVAIIRRNPKLLVMVVVSPYTYAWLGHFLIEKNRPATFKYPLKSLLSDFKMYGKMWQGKMDAEVAKYSQS